MAEVHRPQRFPPNDTISIDMEVRNEGGGDGVYASLVNTEGFKSHIGLYGNGEGGTRLKVTMQARTAPNWAPGEYVCRYIEVNDVYGNYMVSYPDRRICFLVENFAGSYDADELAS